MFAMGNIQEPSLTVLLPGPPSSEGSSETLRRSHVQMPLGSAEKPSFPERWGSGFVYFILASQVLTQTMRRPCGSRAFIRLLGKEVDVVATGRGVSLSWRQAVHLAESPVRGKQSKEAAGFPITSVPTEGQVSFLHINSSVTLKCNQ